MGKVRFELKLLVRKLKNGLKWLLNAVLGLIKRPYNQLFGKKTRYYLVTYSARLYRAQESKRSFQTDHVTLRTLEPYTKLTEIDALIILRQQICTKIDILYFKEISHLEYSKHHWYYTENGKKELKVLNKNE